MRRALEDLACKPDLTATETTAILNELKRVYDHTFDPEKRKLLAGALRSLLLNRELYGGGLRKRFLEAVEGLVFGDIVALAAMVHKDEELGEIAGISPIIRGRNIHIGETQRAFRHMVALEDAGLVWRNPGRSQNKIIWYETELASSFLRFLEAKPDLLRATVGLPSVDSQGPESSENST